MYFPVANIEVNPLVPPLVAFTISFFTSMGGELLSDSCPPLPRHGYRPGLAPGLSLRDRRLRGHVLRGAAAKVRACQIHQMDSRGVPAVHRRQIKYIWSFFF